MPAKLGASAIEQIVELDLDEGEQAPLKTSSGAVRDVVGVLTTKADVGCLAPGHVPVPGTYPTLRHRVGHLGYPRPAMELGLRGRTAIVCGASSGLGLASAEALAAEGTNVAMLARRRDELQLHADRLGALAVRGDVTNAADLERLVERTTQAFGGIDILVWNGGGPPAGTAAGIGDAALTEAFELVLLPAVRLVRLCLPHLERSPSGRIVFVTSAAAKEPTPHLALSNTLRPGVTGFAKSLARELGPKGITVNCVAPGRIDTPRMVELYGEGGPPADELAQIPLGRLGTAHEFGDVVCFLASDRASYVTGVTLAVDGGITRSLL